ncbi:zinc-dependent alcohol dehydrogenase [Enterococcus dongliensis]|uniref:zinc-dependent alcohol dehydrogenase n=1 Tax=Enterococcus dongliensis TaxID=2559925 RepID=UPI002891BA4D|nr:alcohol dehydrogenase catalytic domain-containing protein [Enterococcus dongliensis]MDT2670302.1 alcohol dehydrogenase catalytic domain-containing protein [Enterococcus dongliensis]
MKAIVETGIKQLEIQELPMPKIKKDEVLMKIRANGLCTNDLRDYLGDTKYTYPRIGGHEFSGEIVELGSEVNPKHFFVGDHVVKYIIPYCGECHYCKTGRENLCIEVANSTTFQNPNGISGFFGMSQYIAVKSRDLYKYPKEVPFTHSTFTEPLACVVNSIERAELMFGQDVVIIGGGVMGLFHVILAKLSGTRVILSELNKERRKLAEKLGADVTFDPTKTDPVAFVKEQTGGRGAEVVFNTTALPQIAYQAMELTATGGQTFMFSSMHPNDPVPTDMGSIHSYEKLITGTVSPKIPTFYRAVQLIAKGIVDVTPLLAKTFEYDDCVAAFEYALRPDTLKTIITFD